MGYCWMACGTAVVRLTSAGHLGWNARSARHWNFLAHTVHSRRFLRTTPASRKGLRELLRLAERWGLHDVLFLAEGERAL